MAVPASELMPAPPQASRPDLRVVEPQLEMGYTRDDWDRQLRAEAAPSIGELVGMFEWYVIDRYPEESKPYAEQDLAQVAKLREASDYWQGRIARMPGAGALSQVVEQAYRLTPLFD